MSKYQKISLLLVRLSLGWIFLYSAVTKIMADNWSAAGYLNAAKSFPELFHWFASPAVLPFTNFVNEWGQLLLGVSLILGVFVRYSGVAGALLMLLYYLPLSFPHPNANSYIIDDHLVYLFVLLFLSAINAGKFYGLDSFIKLTRRT